MTAPRRRWHALGVLCGGGLMMIIDATVVNVALPAIKDDLGFSQANLAWVVNAYIIAFGGMLLLGGRLGDLVGRRRMFLIGLATFTLASLLCGLAQSEAMLIGARFLQGAGGALVSTVVLAMIVTLFPEPREQAKAIGVHSFVIAGGASIGLLVGGLILEATSWHWIFLVNVPLGAGTVLLTLRFVEERPGLGLERGADLLGAALLTSGLMLGVFTILKVETWGWASAGTLGWGGLSCVLVAAFVLRQARVANPLMPLWLFRLRNLTGSSLTFCLLVVGPFATFFLGALYMQLILGYSPLEVGLAFVPNALVIAVLSLYVTGPLSLRFGARPVVAVGLLALAVSLLLLARTPVDGTFVADLLLPLVVMGVGEALVGPVLIRVALSDVPPSDAGLASGFIGTVQNVGAAVGLAVVATIAAARTGALRERAAPLAEALNGGYHRAYLVGAALCFAAIGVVFAVLRPREAHATLPDGATRPENAACDGVAA